MKRSDEKNNEQCKKKKDHYLITCTLSCIKKLKNKENLTKQINK